MTKNEGLYASKNIFSLNSFKRRYLQGAKLRGFEEYFKVLSFNQFINEVTELIKELAQNDFNEDMTLRSKAALTEFNNRLQGEDSAFSPAINSMRLNIESRLSNFHR